MNTHDNSIKVLFCQFKSYTKHTIDLIDSLRQGRLDSSATDRAFKLIEENAKLQSLILNQLLDLRGTPDEFNTRISILNFRCYLNTIHYSLYLLREGLLDRSTTIEKFKVIEDKSKLQISLLDKLLN